MYEARKILSSPFFTALADDIFLTQTKRKSDLKDGKFFFGIICRLLSNCDFSISIRRKEVLKMSTEEKKKNFLHKSWRRSFFGNNGEWFNFLDRYPRDSSRVRVVGLNFLLSLLRLSKAKTLEQRGRFILTGHKMRGESIINNLDNRELDHLTCDSLHLINFARKKASLCVVRDSSRSILTFNVVYVSTVAILFLPRGVLIFSPSLARRKRGWKCNEDIFAHTQNRIFPTMQMNLCVSPSEIFFWTLNQPND